MLAFQSSIGFNLLYQAYNNFSSAPQVSTAAILSNIIGGVLRLPIAKVLNIWGRTEGLLVFLVVYIVGIIILAASHNPGAYAAGYVLFYVGYDALYYILDVFVADTTGLRNRAFSFAFASTPFIATAFVGPLAAQSFVARDLVNGWRWGYGTFAIVMPFVFLPLAIVFKLYQRKAEKMGLFVKHASGRTTMQSIVHYIHEFDIVGAFLLIAAFVLFLLPFSLVQYARSGYQSATFIAMVVIGVLLFFVFAAWEKFGARTHFIKWELFKQPTVLGACVLAATLFFSFYCWDLYYYDFVEVVYDLSISNTGYMSQIYNVGSTFWGVVFGIYVRITKHFKYACLFFALPLMMLGAGLMIHFRGQDGNIGYIIMCQIFIAVAGGTLVIGEDMAVMAAADREGVPLMLALIGLSSSLGGAIGDAVAAAIYTSSFPTALYDALPADMKNNATQIVASTTVQLSYPLGSETRNAINYAYGYNQKLSCIASLAVLVLGIPAIAVWKNYNVDKQQNKGRVI